MACKVRGRRRNVVFGSFNKVLGLPGILQFGVLSCDPLVYFAESLNFAAREIFPLYSMLNMELVVLYAVF